MAFDFVTAGIEAFNRILTVAIPDANLRLQTATQLAHEANTLIEGQIELDKGEQASPSFFVKGWRPYVGWVCAGGLTYQVILRPIVQSVLIIWYPNYMMVQLELETLMTLLFGMLGLGAYRSFDKLKGTA